MTRIKDVLSKAIAIPKHLSPSIVQDRQARILSLCYKEFFPDLSISNSSTLYGYHKDFPHIYVAIHFGYIPPKITVCSTDSAERQSIEEAVKEWLNKEYTEDERFISG